jgi:hypothetical protein
MLVLNYVTNITPCRVFYGVFVFSKSFYNLF